MGLGLSFSTHDDTPQERKKLHLYVFGQGIPIENRAATKKKTVQHLEHDGSHRALEKETRRLGAPLWFNKKMDKMKRHISLS